MAHFAELDSDNKVIRVIVVDNEHQADGQVFLQNIFNTSNAFVQTSYNTTHGEHRLGGTPFRKNYACVGYTYDAGRDAFIPPKPYDSWILNEDTCNWEPPIPWPGEQGANTSTVWDEGAKNWKVCPIIHVSMLGPDHSLVFDTNELRWKIAEAPAGNVDLPE